jgi:hypothetical protein
MVFSRERGAAVRKGAAQRTCVEEVENSNETALRHISYKWYDLIRT